jgi:flavodoxin
MNLPADPIRRSLLMAIAGLASAGAQASASSRGRAAGGPARTLVAYFSRSGNTRVVAGTVQRALNADLFEIHAATPYPEDYLATVEQARRERDAGFEPALAAKVPDISAYDSLYLGFPIWGETAPPIIRSFLRQHDLAGKDLIPVITHGGYGLGNSQEVLASHAPKARIRDPFVMQADQERQTMERVNSWLQQLERK